MKTLTKLALLAAFLFTTAAAQAEWVKGHVRGNGAYVAPYYRSGSGSFGGSSGSHSDYVYRNPYAATPSVSVRGYYRTDGTYVGPHYRTAPNHMVTDNLSYRGYASQPYRYVSPRSYRVPRYTAPSSSIYGSSNRIGSTVFHNYYTSTGQIVFGTTLVIGDSSFTTLESW